MTSADAPGTTPLALLLLCFSRRDGASRARRGLLRRLRDRGRPLYDSVILRVDARHRARVYDPRRDRVGAATAALTWGLFGFVTGGGAVGTVVSALSGAICGGLYAYLHEHLLSKPALARIGSRLPAGSSSLALFARTEDVDDLVTTATPFSPTITSVATIGRDLTTRIHSDPGVPGANTTTDLTMILTRYQDPDAAARVRPTAHVQIELITRVDANGRIHVDDPVHGIRAFARSDTVSWGAFGVVVGAVAGAFGEGGLIGLAGGALVTGLSWALFGLLAGTLYGLWAGRAISARRLSGLRGLLVPGTSSVLAWVDGPPTPDDLRALGAPPAQHLALRFVPAAKGTSLAAT